VLTFRQTEDGGYIVAGETESFGAGGTDIWVLKLSSNGDVEWQRTYGGNFDEIADTIQQTEDGGYIVGGRTYTFGVGGFDCWILKLSSSGAIGWQKTYGGSGDWDNCSAIQQTRDGGYIFTGGTNSFDAGSHDAWIIKLNSNGSIEWQRDYGGSDWEYCTHIQETSDGGYIVAGGTFSFGVGNWEILVLKLSPDGEIGPSCGLRVNLNVAVADTSVSPSDTEVTPMDTNVTPRSTNASPQNTEGRTMLLCWNLNQPPLNVSLKREINRSLFRTEALHTISWEPNPLNSQFVIAEYRIYRMPIEEPVGIVSGDTFEYVDRVSDINQTFAYFVTSVDSDGHESPASSTILGE
jgi:hypothetical protein